VFFVLSNNLRVWGSVMFSEVFDNKDEVVSCLDFFSDEMAKDPYLFYEKIRELDPVYRHENGAWYLSRYEDVAAALGDKRLVRRHLQDNVPFPLVDGVLTPFDRLVKEWLVFLDPPLHTDLRAVLAPAFTPQKIKALRDDIQVLVDGLIDGMRLEGGRLDLLSSFAFPLPIQVICRLLGVPDDDWPIFGDWAFQLTRGIDNFVPDESGNLSKSVEEISLYFSDLLKSRSVWDEDCLVGILLAARVDGKPLSFEVVVAFCSFFIWAGHETTKNLISNSVVCLFRNRAQLDLLRQDPGLVDSAVEEVLRFEAPIQKTTRWVSEDVVFGGKVIPQGSFVVLLIGAANRDPLKFVDADVFDIRRKPNAHVSFGRGIHHCLGALLARIEGQVALGTLVRRLPELVVDVDDLSWRQLTAFRSLASLSVRL